MAFGRRPHTDRLRRVEDRVAVWTAVPTTTSPSRSRSPNCSRGCAPSCTRGSVERPAVLSAGGLRLDPATRQVWRGETEISLSSKEFAILETFMRRPGEVLSRYQLLEHAWDYEYENRSNVVDVYVRYLREKVDRPFDVTSIETVRGAGYRLRTDPNGNQRSCLRLCRSSIRVTLAFAG